MTRRAWFLLCAAICLTFLPVGVAARDPWLIVIAGVVLALAVVEVVRSGRRP